jgi:hypothetical protein
VDIFSRDVPVERLEWWNVFSRDVPVERVHQSSFVLSESTAIFELGREDAGKAAVKKTTDQPMTKKQS